MINIEILAEPETPNLEQSRLREYELGLYTPAGPEALHQIILEMRAAQAATVGQTTLNLVTAV